MKNKSTPLVDEHLQSLYGMLQTGTDDFFYTRLKARMEKDLEGNGWNFPLRPVWVVSAMVLLLTVNIFMLSQQNKSATTTTSNATSLQSFAQSYDQVIQSY